MGCPQLLERDHMIKWLKNAFFIDSEPAVPSAFQAASIDLVCREIVRRQMTLPAQMLLESSVPLHFLAGQMLRFCEPLLGAVLGAADVREFAAFVERKGAVEYICKRLEEIQKNEREKSPADSPENDPQVK